MASVHAAGLALSLTHPRFSQACCQCFSITLGIGFLWAQGAISSHNEMGLDIICLEDLFGKGDGVFLAEFFARTDVDIHFPIFRPRVETDMALGYHDKTRHTCIQWVRRFNIIQMDRADFFHVNASWVL